MKAWIGIVSAAIVAVGCGKSGGGGGVSGTDVKHENPSFKVTVPSDLKPGKEHPEGDGGSVDVIADGPVYRDLLLVWARTGSSTDPEASWDRHHHHEDTVKILEEGALPGGNRRSVAPACQRYGDSPIVTSSVPWWAPIGMSSGAWQYHSVKPHARQT